MSFYAPFLEAIAYLRGKTALDTKHWYDLLQDEHDSAFMVAGASMGDVLADLYDAVVKAREQGTTITEFRKAFDKTVQDSGWTYNGKRGWRTRVIYDTNMRQSAMAGRWAQFERLKHKRPWLRYVAVLDNRTRDDHRRWNGLVYHVDDPFWKTHMPLNGWGCRCSVQSLSDAQMRERGLEPSPPYQVKPDDIYEWTNPASGEIFTLEKGIDPGFDYNPGNGRAKQINAAVKDKAILLPSPVKTVLLEYLSEMSSSMLLEQLKKKIEQAGRPAR
jgi:SPP1 gp7 family putative phage head morphogenesis protein